MGKNSHIVTAAKPSRSGLLLVCMEVTVKTPLLNSESPYVHLNGSPLVDVVLETHSLLEINPSVADLAFSYEFCI